MDLNALWTLAVLLLVTYWPIVVVALVLVGGPLLGCVIVAAVGAVRAGVSRPEEARDVDVAAFFEEQAAAVGAGRNDSI
ncbi:hypothetical protein DOE76_07135 [Leifsonia sp. ku-ls]|nr:hypothetical protein DOE76_07135 [Leifsonia sp. ku-ls]